MGVWEAIEACSMGLSLAVASGVDPDLGRLDAAIDPILVASPDARAATGVMQRSLESRGESAPLSVGKKAGKCELAALGQEAQIRAPVRPLAQADARPVGVAIEPLAPSRGMDPRPGEERRSELDRLVEAAGAVVEPEGEIDEGNIEPEEAHHRPGAGQIERQPRDEEIGRAS